MRRARISAFRRLASCAAIAVTFSLVAVDVAAAVETPPVAPASGAPVEVRHQVRKGESLSVIARRNGVTVSALAAANGITNVNRIVVGQWLVIPTAGGPAPRRRPQVSNLCPSQSRRWRQCPGRARSPTCFDGATASSPSPAASRSASLSSRRRTASRTRTGCSWARACGSRRWVRQRPPPRPPRRPARRPPPSRRHRPRTRRSPSRRRRRLRQLLLPPAPSPPRRWPRGCPLTNWPGCPKASTPIPNGSPCSRRSTAGRPSTASLLTSSRRWHGWSPGGSRRSCRRRVPSASGQLLPSTAAWVAGFLIGAPLDPYVADDNIRMSARFLAHLLVAHRW